MTVGLNDLKTFAGRLLYRQLPEEYRYQDPPADDRFGVFAVKGDKVLVAACGGDGINGRSVRTPNG